MMQTKGIPTGQRKGSGCLKSQIYQGTVTSNPVASCKSDTRNLH